MQLSNAPAKLTLPFANSGGKNVIPVPSQTGITPGAASFVDGFPPLTRTPIASGGVPPSGQDMNGVLFDLSAILRWANAGASFVYDAAFAADANVAGYPKGACVLRTDGLGFWLNTTDNNTTDPEAGGAGWVPGFTNGAAAVSMTNANVTLTALQYGKPVIIITGALVANLNLIFPTLAGQWTVINSTTGNFTITCKTAAGTGVVVLGNRQIVCDGTNIVQASSIVTAASDPTYADNSIKAASTGWMRGAMSAIAVAAGFVMLFSNTGYIKFPSWLGGLVINWGSAITNGSGVASFTYSLANPTSTMAVFANYLNVANFAYLGVTVKSSSAAATSAYMSDTAGSPVGSASVGFLVFGY